MRRTIMALAGFAMIGSSAAAAQSRLDTAAQIMCMVDGSSEALRTRLGALVVAEIQGTPFADDDPAFQQLGVVAVACQERYMWSDARLEAAVGWAIARFATSPAHAAVRKAGLDPQAITSAFEALSSAQRSEFLSDPVPDAAVDALLAGTAGLDEPVDTEIQGERVGMLAGLLAQAESNLMKFEAE